MACGPFFLKRRFHPDVPSPKSSPMRALPSEFAQSDPSEASRTLASGLHFGPTVHACVDGMPAAKTFGESAPLTAMLSDIQHGVEHLQIRQPHVSTLHRQAIFDVRVLLFSQLHLIKHSTWLMFY